MNRPSAAVSRNQILFEQEETEVAEKADGFWQTIVSVLSVDSCAPNLRNVRRFEPLVARKVARSLNRQVRQGRFAADFADQRRCFSLGICGHRRYL